MHCRGHPFQGHELSNSWLVLNYDSGAEPHMMIHRHVHVAFRLEPRTR